MLKHIKPSIRNIFIVILSLIIMLASAGCGSTKSESSANSGPLKLEGIKYESKMKKTYAKGFDVYYYNKGYMEIDVHGSNRYLLIPKNGKTPKKLPDDVVILRKPLKKIYLAASAEMALFNAMNALDRISFTATDAGDWYIDAAKAALKDGRITYAGKYSAPDYEMLVNKGCDIAIESTMILHTPEVSEKLNKLGIPVFIDYSSYETHPLGRVEWIKLYGAMTDKEDEAEKFFLTQKKIIDDLEGTKNTDKTVAFFFINSAGQVITRASEDYIPKMIEIAGGKYIFQDLKNPNKDSRSASINMSMEDFYKKAKDSDYLIYNASIESPLSSVDELIAKSKLFRKFKAVKNGNVYTTDKYLYQATDVMGQLIKDIHMMLTGTEGNHMTFLKEVK